MTWRIEVCGSNGTWTEYTSGFPTQELALCFADEKLPRSTLYRVRFS